MSRLALLAAPFALLVTIASPARADVGQTIINRCTHGQSLSGYPQQAYREALQELPTEVEEYSDCANLIRRAQLAAAGGVGGGGSPGAGSATPIPVTPAERSALESAPKHRRRADSGRQSDHPPRRHTRRHRLGPELVAQFAARGPGLPARLHAAARGQIHTKSCPRSPLPLSTPFRRPRARLRAGAAPAARAPLRGLLRADALWWATILIAAIICALTFLAGGGLHLGPMTTVEMGLTIGSGLVVAAIILFGPRRGRWFGLWSVGLLLAFSALTALSVIWSVQPDESFRDAGRMLAYSGLFGASVALARAFPSRWPAVLGGVALAAVVVCAYALLTKVLPRQLDANDVYARLRAPYDYWNATGLTAAMGVICCLWLGARRAGHALLSALAYPATGLMLVTLMLAYSRGALVALALGLALWFCLVPLRLRGAAVLIAGTLGAGVVVAWDFSKHTLTTEGIELGARVTAGRELGALLVAMLVLLTLAGLAIGFQTGRQAPSATLRTRAGAALLAILAVAVIGFAGALAVSHRGLPGSISHAFHSLTDTNAKVANTPGRLTAVASVRARYWSEALKVFKAHPLLGAGAEGYRTARLRYRTAPIEVRHAHGFVVQTLADLGLVGMAIALALLVAWMVAAGRATHPFNRRWTSRRNPTDPADATERRSRTRAACRAGSRPGWGPIGSPGTGRAGGASRSRAARPRTRRSASGCSACSVWSWCSGSIRSSTGPGTCPVMPAWRCSAPGGSPAEGPSTRPLQPSTHRSRRRPRPTTTKTTQWACPQVRPTPRIRPSAPGARYGAGPPFGKSARCAPRSRARW